MTIPSDAECRHLMDHYQMPEHIRAHSLVVRQVAEFLARQLVQQGKPVCVELVVAGALLHDIAKALCLDGDCLHAERGGEICREHGYFELMPLVAEHVQLFRGFTDQCGEREIVYYADKRVRHDQVVSLEERRDDLIRRYAADDPPRQDIIRQNFQICRRLERCIFTGLPLTPAELIIRLPRF
ncbi:MAG: HDIG domain-containing protein [Desulfobulbaceae bacterium]|nr:MAG: HDIG domain-containing protein [Desulfobulbaceae bacterium]